MTEHLLHQLDHPLIHRVCPPETATRFLRLWDQREQFARCLDRLPRTLCHHDLNPSNLFALEEQTVVIDWAYAGVGGIAEDIVGLVVPNPLAEMGADHARTLDEIAFEGYLNGLRDVGWHGEADLVRLGYAGAAALYGNFCRLYWATLLLDETNHAQIEENRVHSLAEILDGWAGLWRYVLDLADEA